MNKINHYWPLTVLLCLFMVSQAGAQTDKYLDKVELTNGSVIWGISEIGPEQVTVYLTTGDSIAIPVEHIKSLKTRKLNPEWYLNSATGAYYQVSVGILVGKHNQYSEDEVSFSSNFVSGYKFNRWWGMGLGMGLDYYSLQRHIPLFIEAQGDLMPGRITPFYQLHGGWSWANERNNPSQIDRIEGGLYLRPALGVKWHFAGYSWQLHVSYVRQQSTVYYEPIDLGNGNVVTNVEDRALQRIGISAGVTF